MVVLKVVGILKMFSVLYSHVVQNVKPVIQLNMFYTCAKTTCIPQILKGEQTPVA